jgi:hypothetical protein
LHGQGHQRIILEKAFVHERHEKTRKIQQDVRLEIQHTKAGQIQNVDGHRTDYKM